MPLMLWVLGFTLVLSLNATNYCTTKTQK